MHVGLLTMKGEKMSKSVGNVVGLAEAIDEFGPEVVRFFYLNAHYRSPLDFVPGRSLEESAEAYRTLSQVSERLRSAAASAGPERAGTDLAEEDATAASGAVESLDEAMSHDFHTREAIAVLFGWSKRVQDRYPDLGGLSSEAIGALLGPFDWGHEVLGVLGGAPVAETGALGAAVEVALAARARARERGDFVESDRIRSELADAGIVLEDGGKTTRWRLGRSER